MVRGFSRFVLFLFLGLLRAPTRNSPERVRDTIWTFPEKSGKHPGLETPRFSFSQKRALLNPPSTMCKWTRPFWGTDCRRAPKSLSLTQAAPLCSACTERARKCLKVSHFAKCRNSAHGLLFRGSAGSPEGVSSSLRPKPSACICSVYRKPQIFAIHPLP